MISEEVDRAMQEAHRLSRLSPQPSPSSAVKDKDDAQEIARWVYIAQDLRSTNEGRRLGLRFAHNAEWLARALGVPVQYVPMAQLQNPNRPAITILGRTWDFSGGPIIQLAQELNGYQRNRVLAHELGHVLKLPDERLCEAFASRFCTMELSEWTDRRRRWRRAG